MLRQGRRVTPPTAKDCRGGVITWRQAKHMKGSVNGRNGEGSEKGEEVDDCDWGS